MTLAPTPAEQGFSMPFEGVVHERTWMAWPSRLELWGPGLDAAKAAYASVARAIARFEPVTMLANEADLAAVRALCGSTVTVAAAPLDDSWLRDSGPTFVTRPEGQVAGVDWQFNSWGGKFLPYGRDAEIAARILDELGIARFAAPFVLEGGSIHADGDGTLLTSEECLLNPNRNPGLGRTQIEEGLRAYTGARSIVWLGQGLENDGTDGHVDNLACFARPGVVIAMTAAPSDANHAPLEDNLARLRAARDARGRAFEIVTLPSPAERHNAGGRLALSYVNFYLVNGGLVMPSFDDPMDAVARATLAAVFPDRTIVQVPALAILEGGGGIHCITQQQPRGAAT